MEITIRFPEIESQLARIAAAIEKLSGTIPTPGIVRFVVTKQESEEGMPLKMIGYAQLTDPDPNAGIVKRTLTISDATTQNLLLTEELPGDAVKSGEIKLIVGTSCHAELVDEDDAGNKSDPGVADFTVTDVMKPPAPGFMGFVPTGQVDEP